MPKMGKPIIGRTGGDVEVTTDDGAPIAAKYRIVRRRDLVPSHRYDNGAFAANKAYPKELQPRDRNRVSMGLQVVKMANELRPADLAASRNLNQGAPVIRPDGVVLNGNGRTLALSYAYQTRGKSIKDYKKYLVDHAEEFGYTKKDVMSLVKGTGEPVLVRVTDESDAGKVGKVIHSTAGGARMGAEEQASADAKFSIDLSGEVSDNEDRISKAVFDTYLNDGIMQMVRGRVREEIGAHVDLDEMGDPVKRDAARDSLPYIRQMLTHYNIIKAQKMKPAYIDRYAVKIEYARRCFDNDSRIRREAAGGVGQHDRQRDVGETRYADYAELDTRRGAEIGGRSSRGVSRSVSGERQGAKARFDKLYHDMAKSRSDLQDGFSSTLNHAARESREAVSRLADVMDEDGALRRMLLDANFFKDSELTEQEQNLSALGEEMGTPVVWMDADANLHGFHSDGVTFLNRSSKMSLPQVFWHESFHYMRANNPALYDAMVRCVQKTELITQEQIDGYRAKIGRANLSDADVIEEMFADRMQDARERALFLKKMGRSETSLARRIAAWIRRMIDRFRDHFHKANDRLSERQTSAMADAFSALMRDMRGANGKPLFRVRGSDVRNADGSELPALDAAGNRTKFRVTNKELDADMLVPIVDVTNEKKVDVNNHAQAARIAKSLIGKEFRIIGAKNGIGRIETMADGRHFVHSSNNPLRFNATRRKALSVADKILENCVYVEKHKDAQHGKDTRYIELFTVVKDGNRLVRFRVVAKEGSPKSGAFEVAQARYYDIIKDGALPESDSRVSLKTGRTPSAITVSDLLKGVKDRNGELYINADGSFNFDPRIFKEGEENRDIRAGEAKYSAVLNDEPAGSIARIRSVLDGVRNGTRPMEGVTVRDTRGTITREIGGTQVERFLKDKHLTNDDIVSMEKLADGKVRIRYKPHSRGNVGIIDQIKVGTPARAQVPCRKGDL